MSSFTPDLNSLASILEDQFSIGENKNNSLHTISSSDGSSKKVRYGALGNFASKFDQSQERRYLEQGYLRRDSFNANPRQLEVSFQQPTATILVKKRAFSSLAENFGEENLDKEEKLFIKATKVLFHNKAAKIASFEKLFKAQEMLEKDAALSSQLMPLILSVVDGLAERSYLGSQTTDGSIDSENNIKAFNRLKSVTDKIRTLYAFTSSNAYTTWITNQSNPFKSTLGQGTGVIELTNVKNFNCNTSLILSEGRASISFSDPYNLMTITSYDIERAISDATNVAYNSSVYEFAKENLKISINDLKTQLNNRRSVRGASPIEFVVNPNTVLGKRVRAIIEGLGIEIPFEYNPFSFDDIDKIEMTTIPDSYLRGGSIAGNDGLDNVKSNKRTIVSGYEGVSVNPTSNRRSEAEPGVSYNSALKSSELMLFGDIVGKIFTLITLEANTRENIKKNNQENNYIRRKLRLHYLGKSIVQPMDQIHIYISSKSKQDRKILGGMQISMKNLDFKQKINNIAADINTIKGMFKPSKDLYSQVEKSVFVGDDFPNSLWFMFRDGFINDNDGTHVFGGVVTSSDLSYNNGSYSVSCSCHSMAEYFSQGRFNWKPSLNVFNGELLDPLTIYKSRFDSVDYNIDNDPKDLLDENKKLIESGVTRYPSGTNVGEVVTKKNLICDEEIGSLGQKKKIIYEPDGLVHRWKEGIGTLTMQSSAFTNSQTASQPSFYEEPFAGQDIMNIISILITGIPYNFVTFYKASLALGSDNINMAESIIKSISNGISKNNIIWGNFVPFKNLTTTQAEVIKTINAQNTIAEKSKEVASKLADLSKINNAINLLNSRADHNDDAIKKQITALSRNAKDLTLKLNQKEYFSDLNQSLQDNLVIIGDNVSYDIDSPYTNSSNQDSESQSLRRKIRKKINFLTRRFAGDVRANQDKNLFIVDDNYDKDYDIWVFNAKMTKMSLYNSEFSSVKDKIEKLSTFLDLEIFCDTQGHIRARSPQYNKMPSSVFFRLLKMKDEYGIELFPKFLSNLIDDQLTTSIDNISVLEDKIRLHCAALKINSDTEIFSIVKIPGINEKYYGEFRFVSDTNGNVANFDIAIRSNELSDNDSQKKFLSTLDGQLKIRAAFSLASESLISKLTQISKSDSESVKRGSKSLLSEIYNDSYVQKIVSRILKKSGERITENDFISMNGSTGSVDVFKVYKNISSALSARQALLKKAANLLKNAVEIKSISSDKTTQNALLMPDAFDYTNIPDIFENLIEDESFDEFGPGSGSRFIIKESQIKDFTIREIPPPFTSIVVNGSMDLFNPGAPAALDANLISGAAGNFVNSAAAVDYDMWRMYGFKSTQTFNAPFLSDPDTQCAPMAVSILNKVRSEIFGGTIGIVGNEYMQPGDVIYVEGRDMLFYVKNVTHTFNYQSKTFSTSLEVNHGRPPGEYIPTKMDLIGKVLYRNRENGSCVLHRHSNTNGERAIGAICLDRSGVIESLYGNFVKNAEELPDDKSKRTENIYDSIFGGKYSQINKSVINSIVNEVSISILQNSDPNVELSIKLVCRVYGVLPEQEEKILFYALGRIGAIIDGSDTPPEKYSNNLNLGNLKAKSNRFNTFKIGDLEVLNIKDIKEKKSPSKFCWDLAKKVANDSSSGLSEEDIIRKNIIDFFLVIERKAKSK